MKSMHSRQNKSISEDMNEASATLDWASRRNGFASSRHYQRQRHQESWIANILFASTGALTENAWVRQTFPVGPRPKTHFSSSIV